jgi:hypothetical protein
LAGDASYQCSFAHDVSKVMFGLSFMSFGQLVQDSAAYSWKNEPNNRVAVHGTVIPMKHLIV